MRSRINEPGKAREAFRAVTRDVSWVAESTEAAQGCGSLALGIAVIMFGIGVVSIYHLVTTGIGVWGNSNTVGWAWDITNFVWWIGIGHAGTLISAILFLFRQKLARQHQPLRRGDDDLRRHVRAGLFPLLHIGRPWFACWMFPIPNDMGSMWPQFRSPLMWDVFAVITYFTMSVAVLVHGPRPRPRDVARSRAMQGKNIRAIDLRHARRSAGAARPATGTATSART